jgi:hypothetical protein
MNAVEIAYSIPGQTWPSELRWLSSAFSESQLHVEVGVFCGQSFFVSCLGLPLNATAVAVDLCDPSYGGTGFPCFSEKFVTVTRGLVFEAIKRHRPDLTLEFIGKASVDAARDFNRPVSSCYVDASHHFAETCADIESWSALLAEGGILAGHDYWPCHRGVMDAVNLKLGSFEIIPGTRIWTAKAVS